MALPTLVGKPNQVKTGPGILIARTVLTGALASTEDPAETGNVAASKFTVPFTGWHYLGYTAEGATITIGRETEEIDVAEVFSPIKQVTTKITGSIAFDLVNINRFNMQAVLNGGTWTVSSSGDTQVGAYVPAGPGEETRLTIAHISEDDDEIFMVYKAFQTAEISISRKKGSEKASLAGASFAFEQPDPAVSTVQYGYWLSGTTFDDYTVIA